MLKKGYVGTIYGFHQIQQRIQSGVKIEIGSVVNLFLADEVRLE